MTTVSFRLDDRLRHRLDRVAGQLGLSLSRVFRDALSEKVEKLETICGLANTGKVPPELRPVVDAAATFPEVDRLILFGSRARGDAKDRADIDLAVACSGADRRKWLDIVDAVEIADTLLAVDLVRIGDCGPELLKEIAGTGTTLYDRRDTENL